MVGRLDQRSLKLDETDEVMSTKGAHCNEVMMMSQRRKKGEGAEKVRSARQLYRMGGATTRQSMPRLRGGQADHEGGATMAWN